MEYVHKETKNRRIMVLTDLHYCTNEFHGTDNGTRMANLISDVREEYEREPFDMILCLGDYSLDFWAWEPYGTYLRTPSVSDTANFMREIYPKFPAPAYMIPGNHEQYGEEKWKKITGFARTFAVEYAEYVFLMCDTFGGELDPTENSDGVYTGIDADFLKASLEKYPGKEIIICAHDLYPAEESNETKRIIRENDRILCVLAGHIHSSKTVILGKEWRNLPVFYCGDYSYCGDYDDAHPNWGYRIIDLKDGFSTVYRRKNH